jgi:uncharacterized protein
VFFSIKELEARKVRFQADFPPGEIEFSDETLRQVSNLHTEGVAELLSNTLGEIRVQGQLSVDMEADCDRCLEPTKVPLQSEFDLFYRPADFDDGPNEMAIDEGQSAMGFYDDGGIELKDVIREHVLLSVPMQQICSEACLGICPQCGKNRNQGDCHCAVKPGDDRWAALRDVKNRLRPASQDKIG